MRLENQCVSLELAKKLKELGITQKSIFCWFSINKGEFFELCYNSYFNRMDELLPQEYISAFTVSELLEMLPDNDPDKSGRIHFGIENEQLREDMGGKYYIVSDLADYPHDEDFYDDNFANAIAEMLIHLIENKLWEI